VLLGELKHKNTQEVETRQQRRNTNRIAWTFGAKSEKPKPSCRYKYWGT